MARIQEIAESLGAAKKTPEGYLCRCPCHDDKTASLSIKEGKNGALILNCFANCSWESVRDELTRRGLLTLKPTKYTSKYDGATFYNYKDIAGNLLCRKVKLPNKKMWIERYESKEWRSGLEKMPVPLYNLEAVLASTEPVYLCEGEKDAETLIRNGLCATTNIAGASHWAPHLSDQLKGKTVVIIPDHDEAGRKRVRIVSKGVQGLVKELRVFMPDNLPDHGDITDWVNAGNSASDIFTRSIIVEAKKQSKHASREEYFELFESTLSNPRKCIFNGKLMYFEQEDNLWNPAVNALELLKSEALLQNETREAKFSQDHIKPHFFAYEQSKPKEFLVEIPEWDHEERIAAMAGLVTLNPSQGISGLSFAELLMEWCSVCFQRLYDPMIQNRILILQGGQGIGKDTWISMLVDGLGQFCIPWANVKDDKDMYLQLHRGLIMKIPEFDKTRNTETSTLKDLITAPSTDIRAPYDKDSKIRVSRCSFISSTNPKNILRDSTGNRRYLIFELQHIEYAYAGWTKEQKSTWQMQCLAEMKALAAKEYKAGPIAWREMNDYIEKETPGDYAVEITEQFINTLRHEQPLLASGDIDPNDRKIIEVTAQVSKQNSIKFKTVKSMVQSQIGVQKRAGSTRFWRWRIPEQPAIDTDIPQAPQQAAQAAQADLAGIGYD